MGSKLSSETVDGNKEDLRTQELLGDGLLPRNRADCIVDTCRRVACNAASFNFDSGGFVSMVIGAEPSAEKSANKRMSGRFRSLHVVGRGDTSTCR